MDALCTIPRYINKEPVATALLEYYSELKPLGVKEMIGGGDSFYNKIGFNLHCRESNYMTINSRKKIIISKGTPLII